MRAAFLSIDEVFWKKEKQKPKKCDGFACNADSFCEFRESLSVSTDRRAASKTGMRTLFWTKSNLFLIHMYG